MEAISTPPLKWRFEHCALEESTLELSANGAVVELERKPLEVLRHLLRHAGEVVTKEELHAAVWPGRVLSDTVLAKAVSRIREVLADDAQAIIKTVHGYGYRLVAAVSVQAARALPPEPVLGLKVGEHPPLRPNWVLLSHLNSGGRGEVWCVAHEKTGERRVFKFALDEDALVSLKREITLHRLLRSQLSDPPIVELLDWNLEEAPFFIELEHLPAGNLTDWAAAQGGLVTLPLASRIELAAQIAEALAQAHAVGVLHKDLKPGNVLVDASGSAPRIRLADFGSGSVVEPGRLDALGITRLGMTRVLTGDSSSVTALYVAPEVLAGQPSTVQSDLYALGVMLYQLVIGDLRRPLSAGWERNVADPLLREDIALAADGNPAHRLADAGELARRLRQLDSRHREREADLALQASQQAALAAAEAATRKLEHLKARRTGMQLALAALVMGLAASLLLYQQAYSARQTAEKAAAIAQAVSNFLNYDVLVATETNHRDTRELSVKQLLDEASQKVAARFADLPEAGAAVHSALSSSYMQLGDTSSGITQRGLGWDMAKKLQASDPEAALRLAVELAPIDFTRDEDFDYWQTMAQAAERKWGAVDANTLMLRNAVALGESRQRKAAQSAARFIGILRDAEKIPGYDLEVLATHWEDLGQEQASLAQFAAAETSYRKALSFYEKLYGPDSYSAVTAQTRYARLLTTLGRHADAERQLAAALQSSTAQRNSENALVTASRRLLAQLRLQQGRLPEAEALIAEVRRAELRSRGPQSQQVVHTGYLLARVHEQLGRYPEAATLIRETLAAQEQVPLVRLYGERRKQAERISYQLLLVRVLTAGGALAEARQTLAAIPRAELEQSWISPLDQAEYWRAEGLLLKAEGKTSAARAALEKVMELGQRYLGPGHPDSSRARLELESLA